MTTHRFEVTPVNEAPASPPELVPLINVPNDVPPIPSTPSSVVSVHETSRTPVKFFNSVIERLKASSPALDFLRRNDASSSPASISRAHSLMHLPAAGEGEGGDSYYSTIHSTTFDTSSLCTSNNVFLQELRSKRRELREKARNVPIDDRIAFNRWQTDQEVPRAQDIFAVHFESEDNDDNNPPVDVFSEKAQEEIREKIFRELDRQRERQVHKQHRQLVLGRALLMCITSIIILMSVMLIYVVVNLYDRANFIGTRIPDIEFISMSEDQTADI